ncbi:MAG: acyl carrier protein [Gemmataceae bacterium]
MTVSSRTPEGEPVRCRVCGNVAALEPSDPGGDVICPSCGALAWFRGRFGADVERTSHLRDLGVDSLDVVELIMELEEQFDVTIPNNEAERLSRMTVAELIDYLNRRRDDTTAD